MIKEPQSVAAVVLAFSRFELLQKLVASLLTQSHAPDEVIIIYQGNCIEMEAWLDAQTSVVLIKQENKGSAGGFCRGIEESIERGHDWTWIFDDDAIPEPTALEELVTRRHFGSDETSFIGSRIVDRHGKTYMSPGGPTDDQSWYGTVLQERCVAAVDACWLGLLVSTRAVREVGLPIAEFFLWDEDREFVSRLVQAGRGYCAISSVIVHYQDDSFDPFGKDFYKMAYYARNHIARAKVEQVSLSIKCFRTIKRTNFFVIQIFQRKAPLRLIPWIFKGIFLFWPKIRRID